MPIQINKYKVFIASPSDLSEERESIASVISELNITYGNKNNVVIELVKWETNSAPGISSVSVQNIINNDIPDYDIFIGLLATRFGTPTKNFGSGTEEEFEIAYKRFQKDINSVQILFYFKTKLPDSVNDIDIDQLSKVQKFKSSLGSKNILHWEFREKEDLCSYLRQHIPLRIGSLIIKKTEATIDDSVVINSELEKEDEELGLIDFQDLMNESLASSTETLLKISESTDWVCIEINKKAQELLALANKAKIQNIGNETLRIAYKRAADVMNTYASKIEPHIPAYFDFFEKGMEAYSKIASIYMDDFDNMDDKISESNLELENLLTQSIFTINQLKEFLAVIEGLPRVSKEINSAKKNLARKLNDLIGKLESGNIIASEIYEKINIKLI